MFAVLRQLTLLLFNQLLLTLLGEALSLLLLGLLLLGMLLLLPILFRLLLLLCLLLAALLLLLVFLLLSALLLWSGLAGAPVVLRAELACGLRFLSDLPCFCPAALALAFQLTVLLRVGKSRSSQEQRQYRSAYDSDSLMMHTSIAAYLLP